MYRLYYELKLLGLKVFASPILAVIGFALFSILVTYLNNADNVPRFMASGIEVFLPLVAGIITVMVTSTDPTSELHLTLPARYYRTMFYRLLIILAWTTVVALVASGILAVLKLSFTRLAFSQLPEIVLFLGVQPGWMAALGWFVAAGFLFGLLFRNWVAGATMLGGIWLAELVFRDILTLNGWLYPIHFFLTISASITELGENFFSTWLLTRLALLSIAMLLLVLALLLARNTEFVFQNTGEA